LDHSYFVGKLTASKIADTSVRLLKVLKHLFQQFLNLSSFHQGISGPILGALSNNRWSGGTISVTSLWRIKTPACDALQELMANAFPECASDDPVSAVYKQVDDKRRKLSMQQFWLTNKSRPFRERVQAKMLIVAQHGSWIHCKTRLYSTGVKVLAPAWLNAHYRSTF
jgi:hypothetical protein